MNIKHDLERIEQIENEVNELVEQREYYYSLATKITPAYKSDGGVGSGDTSKLDTYITKSADILCDIERKLNELDVLRDYCNQKINCLDDVNLRRLLRMRYFMYRKWEDIQQEVYRSYTVEHVRGYLHGIALKKINEISKS